MNLTVACVFVRGPYPYTAEYVIRLERMARRYLQRPFRFVCLVDDSTRPELANAMLEEPGFTGAMQVVPSMAKVVPDNGAGYWNKVRLFDQRAGFSGRVLYIDLDSLIVAPLDPIVDFNASFAVSEDAFVVERAHQDRDRYGRMLVRRFNSSVMVWDAGVNHFLWEKWNPNVAARLSTDQDWIGEQAKHAVALPLAWFPRISRVQPPWPDEAKVVLVKKPKNLDAAQQWPWFDEMWGGWAA